MKMTQKQIEQAAETANQILASSLFLTKPKPIMTLAADIGVSEKSLRALLEDGTVATEVDASKYLAFLKKQATAQGVLFR